MKEGQGDKGTGRARGIAAVICVGFRALVDADLRAAMAPPTRREASLLLARHDGNWALPARA